MDANDITLIAADRLEAALERLAFALEAREQAMQEAYAQAVQEAHVQALAQARAELATGHAIGNEPPQDMVPRAEVERLSARLDEALGRLRALVGDDAGDGI